MSPAQCWARAGNASQFGGFAAVSYTTSKRSASVLYNEEAPTVLLLLLLYRPRFLSRLMLLALVALIVVVMMVVVMVVVVVVMVMVVVVVVVVVLLLLIAGIHGIMTAGRTVRGVLLLPAAKFRSARVPSQDHPVLQREGRAQKNCARIFIKGWKHRRSRSDEPFSVRLCDI